MRFTACSATFATFTFAVAALLVSTPASAAGGVGGKGDVGGKGGPGPESSTQAGAEGSASSSSAVDITETQFRNKSTQNPDEVAQPRGEEKPWEVAANYELHRLIRQQDVAGANKNFQIFGVSGKYLITPRDIVTIFGGATQGFIGDAGETGVRANDISLQYAHTFELPEKLKLRTAAGATIPISYYSQLASNITTPSVSVGLSRKFGDLALNAQIRGAYFWDKYTTAATLGDGASGSSSGVGSGSTNTKWVAGGLLSAEYDMPFHRPLSVGASIGDTYYWYYDVGQPPLGSPFYGATGDPQFKSQPWAQSYAWEVFARYVMPQLVGIKSDLAVAVGNSTPNFVLHDGIVHPYFLYRDTAEVYIALAGRY